MSTEPIVVFSDLDGTLMDHHDYSHAAARPALGVLAARGIPLVLATSKTCAELATIRRTLGSGHPAIAENGGHVLIPAGYFDGGSHAPGAPDEHVTLGAEYATIRGALVALRRGDPRFAFQGFGDMSAADVARETGLSLEDAECARARQSSEPLRFDGDAEALEAFRAGLRDRGLRLNRGGRFFHAQAPIDKADGVRYLRDRYASKFGRPPVTIALGDGENDLGMLELVDHAVVIPPGNAARTTLPPPGPHARRAPVPGPAGWAQALLAILEEMEHEH